MLPTVVWSLTMLASNGPNYAVKVTVVDEMHIRFPFTSKVLNWKESVGCIVDGTKILCTIIYRIFYVDGYYKFEVWTVWPF